MKWQWYKIKENEVDSSGVKYEVVVLEKNRSVSAREKYIVK